MKCASARRTAWCANGLRGVRVRAGSGRTVIEVEHDEGARGTAIREGNRIVYNACASNSKVNPFALELDRQTEPLTFCEAPFADTLLI